MEIKLAPEWEEYVLECVALADYSSAEDVIETALQVFRDRPIEITDELLEELEEAEAGIAAGNYIDFDTFVRQWEQRIDALSKAASKDIMMHPPLISRCAIHTQTNKPWTLAQCVDAYAQAGVGGISVWRDAIEPIGVAEASRIVRGSGLAVPALVRGGFFVARDSAQRQKALDVNRQCIDEAQAIGAEMVVLVVGAMEGIALDEARRHVAEGISAVLDHTRQANVKLAIEPLHPMYAADRSCINRMAEARAICESLRDPMLGIAVDVYHVWWDPDLKSEIELAGRNKTLFGFHVCDWRANQRNMLTDRGLMGEGCIDIRTIRAWVEDAGFAGFTEVEIFSDTYWAMDQNQYLQMIVDAYRQHV